MKFLSLGLSFLVALNLIACAESSNRPRKDIVEDQDKEPSLQESITSVALRDSFVDNSLILRIQINSSQIETFLVDDTMTVQECTNQYCTSFRPSSNEKFVSVATGNLDGFVLDITARYNQFQGQSIRVRKHSYTPDDFWMRGTFSSQAHLDSRIQWLQSHYSDLNKSSIDWTVDLAYIVGTGLASAIVDDEREWNIPSPYDERSHSILTIASNINLPSRSEYVESSGGVVTGGADGLESGTVKITMDGTGNSIDKFEVTLFGRESSSFTIQYDRLP